jgi:beta-galactosidase
MKKTIVTITLLFLVISTILSFAPLSSIIHAAYTPPANNRIKFNFNHDWRFCKKDLISTGVHPESTSFTENPATQTWQDVSLPHCYSDTWWREWISTNIDGADPEHALDDPVESNYTGKVWYRKHFTIDSAYSGRKVVLEFQAISLIANFYVNGQSAGSYQSGVGPCGVDITDLVNYGGDNLIAVEVNNGSAKLDQYGNISIPYGWPFNPNFGGINRDVTLHIFDKCYQTLPLYRGLGTQGTYVYAQNIDTLNKTAAITMQAEVKNEYATAQNVTYNATVVDRDGNTVLTTSDVVQNIAAGQTALLKATVNMTNIHFWAPDYPYLYQVFTSLKINGTIVDLYQTPMGVRSVTFTGTDGLHINGHRVFLKGYAPRTPMEWPCVLIPPDWMVEYDFKLMHEENGNFLRPMHMAPRKNQVDAADKFGIIVAVPAVAGENQPATWDPNEWQFRLDAMRDVMIYFRNNPSVVFYEGNNGDLYAQNMQDMVNVRKTWDPYGGRYMGTRSTGNAYAEFWSPMDGASTSSTVPCWDAEYARGESPRRVWDDYTPILNPRYNTTDSSWTILTPITPAPDTTSKYVTGGYFAVSSNTYRRLGPDVAGNDNSISHYPGGYFRLMSSEEMVKENLAKYYGRYVQSAFVAPLATRQTKGVMVGGAKIIWADSTTDGRMKTLEMARVSGVLDGARLPKEVYYGLQVAQNDSPQVYIVGHWNYPAGTTKTVYVAGNTDQVKLITYDTNGSVIHDYGYGDNSDFVKKGDQINHYLFVFNNVQWQSGSIKAIGYNGGTQVAQNQKYTVGAPAKIKLTAMLGPDLSLAVLANSKALS